MEQVSQRGASRTRTVIVEAFNRLVLHRRMRRIGIADVLAEAGIARSTFYDHFGGAEQLHMAALAHPFAILANAMVGRADATAAEGLLAHFWHNRARARDTLEGRTGEQVFSLLAGLIEERLEGDFSLPRRLVAAQLAGAALAPLRTWLLGQSAATAGNLAESLCRSGTVLVAASKSGN